MRDVIHRFNEICLACLDLRWAGGRPRLLRPADEDFVIQTGHHPPKAREIAVELSLGMTPAKGRGGAFQGQASGPGTRVAPAGGIGEVQRQPAARGRAGRRLIRVTLDHRITASLLADNVS